MGDYTPYILISVVKNGFIVSKGGRTYVAFTESEILSLVKVLLHEDDLPEVPF